MHYGGDVFHAHDLTTHQLIPENTKLTSLDIEKLNYYYPPISKLFLVGLNLESRASSNKMRLSSVHYYAVQLRSAQNRRHRNEDLSKCEPGDYATGDNFTTNDANNKAIDDQINDPIIMVEFNKVGFPLDVLARFAIGQDQNS